MVTKLITKVNKLRYRRLSLRGKAIILNTVSLSKIWFIASLWQLPKWALNQIEKHIFAFIWENRRMEPIQRKTLYLPTDLGGLGILHPLLQRQALTIKYFLFITDQNKQITWLQFARYWMSLRLAKYDPQSTMEQTPQSIIRKWNKYSSDINHNCWKKQTRLWNNTIKS